MKYLYLLSLSILLSFSSFALDAPATMCAGSNAVLSDYITGTWSSSNTAIATVSLTGSSGSNIYAVIPGTVIITHTNGSTTTSATVTIVASLPAITGNPNVCMPAGQALSNSAAGGTWSSSNASIATVSSAGVVFGVSAGSAVITYSIGGTCSTTFNVTVNGVPSAISGSNSVCAGGTITLSHATAGGTWSSTILSVATVDAAGVVSGVAVGYPTILYTLPSGCVASHSLAVTSSPIAGISGSDTVCAGSSATFTAVFTGGTASSYVWKVNGVIAGTGSSYSYTPAGGDIIDLSITGTSSCGGGTVTAPAPAITIITAPLPTVYMVTGGGTYCGGTAVPIGLSGSAPGISYQLYLGSTAIGSPVMGTGTAISFTPATGPGTYVAVAMNPLTLCLSSMTGSAVVTVAAGPTVTATVTEVCGVYTFSASGATSYVWSPVTGLTCHTCATATSTSPNANYTVVGTTAGCSGSYSVTVNLNQIYGNINYSGGTSSDTFTVWLVQYDPTDSSVLAVDSTTTCWNAGMPYYQFSSVPAGSYKVKAKLRGSIPGSSGYIPTYGLSSANWFGGSPITHTTGRDNRNINMIYGTVPAGSGFIAGNVYYGAGKGTTGDAPAVDMLILLRNTATNVLTYTYTDATGAYSFNNLAYGDYVIYPEEYDYYTTPSAVITLSAATPSAPGINFKQHTDYGTITPYGTTAVQSLPAGTNIALYPNPVTNTLNISWVNGMTGNANITITDVTGRVVYTAQAGMHTTTGKQHIDMSKLANGSYIISIKGDGVNYISKIQVQR